ncbi:MFS transporter [Streptomyces sp. NPDC088254]|uniref:MFS transporter n=1 Tax=Streptomyces sp. NPDC088254 TaxID=3365847 RepID=UPI0037FD6317
MPETSARSQSATAVPQASGDSQRQQKGILALLCGCVVLVVGMVAAINLAIPKIGGSGLHPSSSQMLWIVDSYVIVFAGLLIPAGVLGDHYGHKKALVAGLTTFCAGSVVSALAPGTAVLITGRAVTGVGAALVLPPSLSVVVHVFAPAQRPHVIATWTAMTGLGGVIGNLGGGVLLQFLSWRALFFAAAPVALALLVLVAVAVPSTPKRDVTPDTVGSVLLVAGFLALLYSIIEGPEKGWSSVPVLSGFAAAALLLAAFTAYELRRTHPLLDPRLFRLPKIRAGALGIGATFFGMFALFYVNAQYLQYVKGFSALMTGLGILPLAVGMLLVSRRSVPLAKRFGASGLVAVGMLCIVAGLLLLSLADRHTPYPLYALFLVVMAVGAGLSAPSLSFGIMSSLPPHQAGLGSGINSSTRELGSALGVAVVGTVLNTQFTDALPDALRERVHSTAQALGESTSLGTAEHLRVVDSFAQAMDNGYRMVAGVMIVVSVLVLTWIRKRDTDPSA